jgi:uncharacterized NAD(P)/FAD-binding protein YdhS
MHALSVRLLELVQKLDSLGPCPSLAALEQAMKASQLTLADVAPFVQPNPQSYNRSAVVVREHYDLLVMTWLPGQASVPHDHGRSVCVLRVIQGKAAEVCYRVAADGFVDPEYEEQVRAGEVRACQDAGIHTVRNPSSTGETLVTVHVYAPRLRNFRQFVLRPEQRGSRIQAMQDCIPTVVIAGGGFSGSMTAAHILRRARKSGFPIHVALVEPRGAIGEGVAYSSREPAHLLNVPAGRMSAWPDRPDDFVDWALRRYGNTLPTDFLPRQWYGEYIRDSLLACAAEAGKWSKFSIVFDEVRRAAKHPRGGWMVHLEQGSSLRADAIVLAIGHRPPSDPIGTNWHGPRTRFIADPWRPFALNAVRPVEAAVVLGSGLTAVDAVLSLAAQPRSAPVTLVSPNGLLPLAHAARPLPPADLEFLATGLVAAPGGVRALALLSQLRRTTRALAAQGVDWRSVVDGLRPYTARLWQAMPLAERRRFLSRVRPFWEVHRHRMAPSVGEKFRGMLEGGEVRIVAGQVVSARAEENEIRVVVRPKGAGSEIALQVGWIINCTGPLPPNCPESNPVIGSLLINGCLCLDKLALGVETAAEGNAVGASREEVPGLFVVGTLRKPTFWESTAVPELREQAAIVAGQIFDGLIHSRLPAAAKEDLSGQPRAALPV